MQQLVKFNVGNAGTTLYKCLQNVRLGYGIPPKNATAKIDWDKNLKQHKDRAFPAGCSVPIYFNLTIPLNEVRDNYGHIAVALPDSRFWTDGRYYNSIEAMMATYLKNGNPSYLGWGESVNGVRVVGDIIDDNMACKSNANFITDAFNATMGRNPSQADIAYHIGRPHDVVLAELMNSDGRKNYLRDIKAKDLRIAQLEKQLAEDGTVLSAGKYIVK